MGDKFRKSAFYRTPPAQTIAAPRWLREQVI